MVTLAHEAASIVYHRYSVCYVALEAVSIVYRNSVVYLALEAISTVYRNSVLYLALEAVSIVYKNCRSKSELYASTLAS